MSIACTLCSLCETAITVGVSSRGPDHAPFLFVGEAPGTYEDTQGVAFVGRSGVLLDEMLAAAGFKPDEVRITNAVRCIPPRYDGVQQKPTPTEIEACRTHLRAEIAAVQPRAIIALGDTALVSLCKTSGVASKRGGSYPLHPTFGVAGIDVWPTYHPAFVARVDSYRDVVVADLRRVRASGTPEEAVPFALWDGQPLRGGLIAFDIETLDADGAIIERPTQMAVASRLDGVLVTEDVAGLAAALVDAQRRGAWTVGHNAWGFDVPKLRALEPTLAHDHDTMALAYLENEEQPLALESLCVKYLGVRGWKEDGRKDARLGTHDFRHYNARDAWYTLMLCERLFGLLTPKQAQLNRLLLDMRRGLDACTERGIRVKRSEIERLEPEFDAKIAEALAVLREQAGDAWIDPDKKLKQSEQHNPNSGMQVARVLASRGISTGRTPTGKPKVDKALLEELQGDSYIDELRRHREATKSKSTYIEPYKEVLDQGDGRVHSTYTILRTRTNRTSCSGPNVQNINRDLDLLDCTKVDYSAIEFRTAAWCAREPSIIEQFAENPTWDPHRYFAGTFLYQIPLEDVTKEQRQIAKSANFSQLYLGTWITVQDYCAKMGIVLSDDEARRIHRLWHQAFPAFRPWYNAVAAEVYAAGYVETATGFRRHFGDIRTMPKHRIEEIVREAVNCKSQTLAAHIAYMGMARLMEYRLPVVGFFHDAYGFDFAEPWHLDIAKPQIIEATTVYPIQRLREQFGVAFDVPLVVQF